MDTYYISILTVAATLLTEPACAGDVGERAFYRGEYAKAYALLLVEASSGGAVAQSFVGYQYQYGLGAPQSFEEAARWFSRAATQGEPTAQFFLGLLYDRGQGVEEDPVEAEKWLSVAASHASAGKHEYWDTMRDTIGSKLTKDELTEASRRAAAWFPVRER
jgi:TPR repeat protein